MQRRPDLQPIAKGKPAERSLEIRPFPGQLDIAERVDVDHGNHKLARHHSRRRKIEAHKSGRIERRPERLERHTEREVGAGRGEDVPAVERRADHGEPVVGGLQDVRGDDPAQTVRGRQEDAVVRPHQHVAPRDANADRQARGPHARVDDSDVNSDGQVRQRGPQEQRPVEHCVLRHFVADIEQPDVGSDAEDHAPADRRQGVALSEVRREAHQRPWIASAAGTGIAGTCGTTGTPDVACAARAGGVGLGGGGGQDGARERVAHRPMVADRTLRTVRVRVIWLRMLALVATLLWGAAALAVLLAYHPRVPVAPLVAATPMVGTAASLCALAWPPLVRSSRGAAGVVWVGILEILLLAPSLAGLVSALRQPGASPFLPSGEDAYAWFLTLVAASLLAGIGMSRHVLGGRALGRSRLALAGLIAATLLAVGSGVSGVAVVGTQLAFSSGGSAPSGPAGGAPLPPTCSSSLRAATNADVTIDAMSQVDGRELGTVELAGVRAGQLERWAATLGGWPVEHGGEPETISYARTSSGTWLRPGSEPWSTVPLEEQITPYVAIGATPAPVIVQDRETLDSEVIRVALSGTTRLAAEDLGIELVGRTQARHCQLLAGGSIALQAFRPLRWLLGQAALSDATAIADWRGTLDWWVGDDGTLRMAAVSVEGLTPAGWPAGLQATLQATLTARASAAPPAITVPVS